MAYRKTLPIVAGLSILGAGAGLLLGEAAVSEINPAYYSTPISRFHADQVPHRSPDWAQSQVSAPQEVPYDGLGAGCIGCGGAVDQVYAAPAVATYDSSWSADARRAAEVAVAPAEPAPDPALERVARYASYPVSSEEAESRATAVQEAEGADYASAETGAD